MDALLQDLRYALRSMARRPGFALLVVLTMALGTGVNVAMFTLLDTLLLSPLPYAAPGRLVALSDVYQSRPSGAGMDEFHDWEQGASTFEDLALAESDDGVFAGDGSADAERVVGTRVSAGFFEVLGVPPLAGRTFRPGEDLPGRADVVVLSYSLWQRRFAGSLAGVGRRIRIGDRSYTVVGVMPRSFFWVGARAAEFWRPLGYTSSGRMQHQYDVVGRLKPGVSLAAAQAQLDVLARRAAARYPDAKGWSTVVTPLGYDEAQAVRLPLLVLALAAGLVLLIACANVASLTLVKTAARTREMAVRAALGASRGHLARQLLVESATLAVAATGLGVLGATWVLGAVAALVPPSVGLRAPVSLDAPVLAFSLAVAMATTLLVGLVPARRASRVSVTGELRASGSAGWAGAPQRRLLGRAVVLQVALAAVLLVASGLLLSSLRQLLRQGLGFRRDHLLTMQLQLPASRYGDAATGVFYRDFLARLGALPGVASAAASTCLPMSGYYSGIGFEIEGRETPAEWRQQSAQGCVVTAGYFRTLGMGLVRGRDLAAPSQSDLPVAVISDELAQRFWPADDPVGQRIRYRGSEEWRTIVGVVADWRYGGPTGRPEQTIYRPYVQGRTAWMFVVARVRPEPSAVVGAVRRALRDMDPSLALSRVATMDDLLAGVLTTQRLVTALLTAFGLLAVLLAALGLYGVLGQSVALRTQEIGVRVTLGATRAQVLRMVLARGLLLAGAGTALGLAVAAVFTRALRSLLYGVSPLDPVSFVVVVILLCAVSLLASWLPARRAAQVDPVVALKSE
jgi:putative ABC transport system permease protein